MPNGHAGTNGGPPSFNPPRDFDERGRLLPMTDEQRRARLEEGTRVLEAMAGITDETDTDKVWDEVMRNLGIDPAAAPDAEGATR